MRHARFATLALAAAVLTSQADAHPGGWGGGMGGWGREPFPSSRTSSREAGPAEGRVEVNRFIAEDVNLGTLGKGTLAATAAPAGDNVEEHELRTYEAAVLGRLAETGYQTATTQEAAAQIAEVRVLHSTVVPEESPLKPVSGEATVGVSNRGSMMGLALAVDLSKPAKALIGTRLEARIRDKASGKVLWEGRADIVTREGNPKWTQDAIAQRLARALFEDFPGKSGETRTASR